MSAFGAIVAEELALKVDMHEVLPVAREPTVLGEIGRFRARRRIPPLFDQPAWVRMGGDRSQRPADALSDLIERRPSRARPFVHVEAAPDLNHEGAHPEVLAAIAHRHERAGEGAVDRHAPAQRLEGGGRGVA